jgi:hypothetical protein
MKLFFTVLMDGNCYRDAWGDQCNVLFSEKLAPSDCTSWIDPEHQFTVNITSTIFRIHLERLALRKKQVWKSPGTSRRGNESIIDENHESENKY